MIKIDFSFYIAILLALFLRQIDIYLTYLIAILIHECGHLVMATKFGWQIEEFKISAIGGFLTFKNDLARPIGQSFFVACGGILFNVIFGLILITFDGPSSLIYTQFAIAIFNLLPITPLDGSRIVQAVLRHFFHYKTVLNMTKYLNFIFLTIFILGIIALKQEQYFIVALLLAILVGKYKASAPYLYERYKIQSGRD